MSEPKSLSRRALLALLASGMLANPLLAQTLTVPTAGGDLRPQDAHALAVAGKVFLVDIRRPDEWAATGSGEGAHRIDLRRGDFLARINGLVEGDRSAPIALICARGVRSDLTSRRLRDAGFTNVIDVPEGMLGSRSGPGWIRRKLPLVR